MSQSQAIREARALKKIVESYGVRCTIELQIGRPWSGSRWYSRKHVLMNHHTAGPMGGLTPSLAVCKYGRPGIPGPLCNGYMGRDLVFRIICMGLANHPGAGGPLTRDGVTLPRDSARIASFGIEFDHDGRSSWPRGFRDAMAKVGAAVMDWLDRPSTSSIEHSTWTTRKVDRAPGYARSGSTGVSEIKAVRGSTGRDWFDMATEADLRKVLREEGATARNVMMYDISIGGATKEYVGKDSTNAASLLRYAGAATFDGRRQHSELRGELAGLSAAVAQLAVGQGIDPDAIEAAARRGAEAGAAAAIDDIIDDAEVTLNVSADEG
ncbi:MAG TPA: hypothetical protein VK053_07150 [Jiangellaceae bacterium]|nr:hypothetical protein [Jiangellaceae bacterium]